ncbi:lysine N(6)-hydroxylase/L-ornithine N(5)-oxygenase family protein (plasmid) [Bacillus toyonensis]|uniref:lysine N(6)-hydroxylase/L-ornithine N(5)-oxygenase family protein n=1 Tax=Bacillus cereus group TaxID=86661 RepID=UPI000BEC72A2|nr:MULTISPECIES: SidA/IucD/PvdA family monooxygenase [Bacillus cereus group]MBJ7930849.1 lysine N(6)-hydroxylase/L-ornithine N(5)-oxygenase family protein [Bacillus cereus group sp. N31]PDY87087.1 monooxygenase [Bacillus toyonensis]PED90585.1 monooxygenase [Bacillus toyonensis]PEG13710.1 monooxygenase [Bacillus toyonensis]PEK41709.1 monooxygenase [Bacillus toyonensis]
MNNKIYDVIGIGFGPANLALATAIEEENNSMERIFLEEKTHYQWHPGMLLDNTNIQISFLKDLVTLKNPKSKFSFLNYLHENERLSDFINLSEFYPSRLEYNDYMSWVASQLEEHVYYSRTVISVDPIMSEDSVELLEVIVQNTKTNQLESYITKNIVLATGGTPRTPINIEMNNSRVFHSSQFKNKINNFEQNDAHKFLVVGSGQSSAELFFHLINNYPKSDITATMRPFSYKAVNESKLVNRIFDANMIDFIYSLPEKNRDALLKHHSDTNYAAADGSLISQINKALYNQKFHGEDRFRIKPFLELTEIKTLSDKAVVYYKDIVKHTEVVIEADAVILATGYESKKNHPLLKNLNSYISDNIEVSRNYRLETTDKFKPGIYLQGVNESTHGLSDTLLSNLSIRSNEILKTVQENNSLTEEKTKNVVS